MQPPGRTGNTRYRREHSKPIEEHCPGKTASPVPVAVPSSSHGHTGRNTFLELQIFDKRLQLTSLSFRLYAPSILGIDIEFHEEDVSDGTRAERIDWQKSDSTSSAAFKNWCSLPSTPGRELLIYRAIKAPSTVT